MEHIVEIRAALIQEQAAIEKQLISAREQLASKSESLADEGEVSLVSEARSNAEASIKLLTKKKNALLHALSKTENNDPDFGFCEDCGDEIPAKRLKLVPTAVCCSACQDVREKKAKHFNS